MQEREHLLLQAQQLQVQLAKAGEDAKQSNLHVSQLVSQLDEKTLALEMAEVGEGRAAGRHAGGAEAAVPERALSAPPPLRLVIAAPAWLAGRGEERDRLQVQPGGVCDRPADQAG